MKRIMWLAVLLALLAIPVVQAVPLYQDITNVPTTAYYNPSGKYSFTINWTDSNTGGFDNATFENNFNGTTYNVTATNSTVDIFYVNFTMSTNITSGGSYTYKWYGINTTGTENVTAAQTFTVNKNTSVPVRMNMTVYGADETESNVTDTNTSSYQGKGNPYVDSWMRLVDGTGDVTLGTTSCYRDGVAWTKGTSGAVSLQQQTYTVKCNSTGNVNYTDNSTGATYYLVVLASGGGGGGYIPSLPTVTIPRVQIPTMPSISVPIVSVNIRERIQIVMSNIQIWMNNFRIRLMSMLRLM